MITEIEILIKIYVKKKINITKIILTPIYTEKFKN